MYSLRIAQEVLKELADTQRYSAKVYRQITLKIMGLSGESRPSDTKRIGGGWRVDSGEYRIYYEIDDANRTVTVLLVGKRGDDEIYRQLKRRFG